jgi:hypothetical protein
MLNNLSNQPIDNDDTIMQSLMSLLTIIGNLDDNSELLRVAVQAITDYKILRNQIKILQNIVGVYEERLDKIDGSI